MYFTCFSINISNYLIVFYLYGNFVVGSVLSCNGYRVSGRTLGRLKMDGKG